MAEIADNERERLAVELFYNYSILENGPAAISGSWIYNSDRGELIWSDGMYRLFDMEPGATIHPDIYIKFASEEDQYAARKIANAIMEGTIFDEQVKIETGITTRLLRVVGAPRDVKGERRMAGVDIDLTYSNEINHGGEPSYEQLRRSDKAKTNFFNNLSREFQNPVTLVRESINQVIRKVGHDVADNVVRELQNAQRNAVRVEKLVRTLNDFSHMERRKDTAVFQSTDVCKLATEIAAGFRPVIESAGLSFSIQCDRIAEQIYVDREIFEIVLFNLLSNAYKFTFEGGITITVSNTRKHVKVSVIDTGCGISPADQRRIFQRFATFEARDARAINGMGVGLPLVKDLVEIHGGVISVDSTPGKGSKFVVSFPKDVSHIPPERIGVSAPGSRAPLIKRTITETSSWPARGSRYTEDIDDRRLAPTVVIAESDKEMRDYIKRALSSKYKTVEADSGQQVLDLIESGFSPDLILADVVLSRVSGFELLQSVKHTRPNFTIPVILLTNKSTEEEEVRCLYYGADDCLVKPFSMHELVARVDARIELSKVGRRPFQVLTKANIDLEEQIHHYMMQLEASNKELAEKNAKLVAINEELTGLTFATSHDLREPMRKIRLFVGRIVHDERNKLSDNSGHYFQRVLSLVQTMNELVSDISLYANFNNRVGPICKVDLNELLSSLVDLLTPKIRETGASIVFNVTDGLYANQHQVRQVVYNLVSNALKFRRSDVHLKIDIGGQVVPGKSIANERANKDKSYYQLDVTDNGIGIEPSHHKQIFELFRRLHGGSTYSGTGIGLTIVRRIMENHDGFITVTSSPGVGSTFSCYFPTPADT
ncbi:MAG TPA: ATP-binding protein [Cyclobacteriaceae bacterium]|nr:ATP-binding protein [Cyclobacteriaceae bacterium]